MVAGVVWAGQMGVLAQTQLDLRSQVKNVDFSAAAATKPNKSGTELPAVCGVGETFFLTTADPGHNLYGCVAPNAWSLLGAAVLPASDTPGQFLVWDGSAWTARSGLGVMLSLAFPAVADGACTDQSGALPYPWAAGTPVTLTPPAQYCDAAAGVCSRPAGWVALARVSATGIGTVRMCNFSGVTQSLPAANYALAQYLDNTTTVNVAWPALDDGSCATQTVPVQGVTGASALALGLPPALESGLIVTASPAGTNSVTVTGCNWSGARLAPAAASYQISVI
jgi:hypothetical protein